ncbi:AMP-binding protein, partial [Nocardiopsis tropica]|nr:AMP-binding protein [Nocardiopsis tropica]
MTKSPATHAPTEADLRGPVTDHLRDALLHDIFATWAARQPGAPAVRHRGRALTYGELARRSRDVAASLLAAGARPGDAVGVCGRRSPEALVAF